MDCRASPPFPHNGIKSLPTEHLRGLFSLLQEAPVNWRDVSERLRTVDDVVKEFIQQKSGQSLAALAAAQPMNSAFTVTPRAVNVNATTALPPQHDPEAVVTRAPLTTSRVSAIAVKIAHLFSVRFWHHICLVYVPNLSIIPSAAPSDAVVQVRRDMKSCQ